MCARRGESGLSGILLVDKPTGLSSHDVVNRVRRAVGEKRVGHAGTLDPMATGLLVILVGPATRLEPYLSCAVKRYSATIAFGVGTDTLDATGVPTETVAVPAQVAEREFGAKVLDGLLGPQMQIPPAFSAIKRGGKTAYQVARAGGELELEARAIDVRAAKLIAVTETGVAETPVHWDVDFEVSKGTYIRSLARDIGVAVGCVAHLAALRRTASGHLSLADAHLLDEIAEVQAAGVSALFADPIDALGLPVLEAAGADITTGRPVGLPSTPKGIGTLWSVLVEGRLAALYREEQDRLAPVIVLATPVGRSL